MVTSKMRTFIGKQSFIKINTIGLGALLAVALIAAPNTAGATGDAYPGVCELDWNCDGQVTGEDFWEDGDYKNLQAKGFQADVYYYTQYQYRYFDYVDGGWWHKQQCGGHYGNMDWNGDGEILVGDSYKGQASSLNMDTFYTQWYVFEFYPIFYTYYYPNSSCMQSISQEDAELAEFIGIEANTAAAEDDSSLDCVINAYLEYSLCRAGVNAALSYCLGTCDPWGGYSRCEYCYSEQYIDLQICRVIFRDQLGICGYDGGGTGSNPGDIVDIIQNED